MAHEGRLLPLWQDVTAGSVTRELLGIILYRFPDNPPMPQSTPPGAAQLHHLVIIRSLILACLLFSGGLAFWLFDLRAVAGSLLGILLAFASINLLTYWRLKQPLPVTEPEIFIQLLLDVVCLTLVFYFSGGASNPFVSYFLVPICIAATTLAWSYTWSITLLCICAYSLLLFFHQPLPAIAPDHGHHHESILNAHIIGMWLNFFISAVLITYFVVRMGRDLRGRDQQLNQLREDELRDDQLMAVATLAAGTAHELGTPLATMKVLLGELRQEYQSHPTLSQDFQLLSSQVEECARTLRHLVDKAEETRTGNFSEESIRDFCQSLIERWQLLRPQVKVQITMPESLPDLHHRFHPTIAQSLINLLNNAADANPQDIRISIHWDSHQLVWQIEDQGPGIPLELADQLGKAFITTKGQGLGLGLFLSHASLSRYGGQVRLYNRKPRGTLTEVILPLNTGSH